MQVSILLDLEAGETILMCYSQGRRRIFQIFWGYGITVSYPWCSGREVFLTVGKTCELRMIPSGLHIDSHWRHLTPRMGCYWCLSAQRSQSILVNPGKRQQIQCVRPQTLFQYSKLVDLQISWIVQTVCRHTNISWVETLKVFLILEHVLGYVLWGFTHNALCHLSSLVICLSGAVLQASGQELQ